jgi:hypothetical protein
MPKPKQEIKTMNKIKSTSQLEEKTNVNQDLSTEDDSPFPKIILDDSCKRQAEENNGLSRHAAADVPIPPSTAAPAPAPEVVIRDPEIVLDESFIAAMHKLQANEDEDEDESDDDEVFFPLNDNDEVISESVPILVPAPLHGMHSPRLCLSHDDFGVPELEKEIYVNYDDDFIWSGQDLMDWFEVAKSEEDPATMPSPMFTLTIDPKCFFIRGFIFPHTQRATTWTEYNAPSAGENGQVWKQRNLWHPSTISKNQRSILFKDLWIHRSDITNSTPNCLEWIPRPTFDDWTEPRGDLTTWTQTHKKKLWNMFIETKLTFDMTNEKSNDMFIEMFIPAHQLMDRKTLVHKIQNYETMLARAAYRARKYRIL